MVKDEDVCVHCGLCAERCPTAAWDMQKFELTIPYAGQAVPVETSRAWQVTPRINDFAFKLANVNGTGSASANGLLMQAIFRMGIPVSGKNLFPSNIQGLPTWYEIRVNKDGHTARTSVYDLMVAMNAETYARDVEEVRSGGYVLYDSIVAAPALAVPRGRHHPRRALRRALQRRLQRVARAHADEEHLLRGHARRAARDRHGGRLRHAQGEVRPEARADGVEQEGHPPRLRLRQEALRVPAALPAGEDGRDQGLHPHRRQHRHRARLSSTRAPRSPPGTRSRRPRACSTRSPASARKYRTDKATGKRRYAILQAEDELAAIGMVIGAGWNGARVVHVDLGPRHLADERAHRARLLRRDPRGDRRRAARRAVHRHAHPHAAGRHPARARTRRTATPSTSSSSPPTRRSASSCAAKAFDLAERFQTPVFMLTDLDIGMNDWVVPRLSWDDSYTPGSRQGAHRRRDRGPAQVLPLLPGGRARRRGAHAARGEPQGRLLHARLGAQQARRLHRDPRRVPGRDGAPAPQAQGGARPRAGGRHREARGGDVRRAHRRRLRSRGARGAGGAGSARHPGGLLPRARLPLRRRRRGVPRRARDRVRRRAEPRRPAPLAPRAGDRGAQGQAQVRARLRRLPAPGDAGRRRASRANWVTSERQATSELHQETRRSPPVPPAQQARAHRARLRGIDVDPLRRLRSRLDHRRHRPRLLRAGHAAAHGGQGLRASAARRRRRPTSSPARTASTPRTGACRRS